MEEAVLALTLLILLRLAQGVIIFDRKWSSLKNVIPRELTSNDPMAGWMHRSKNICIALCGAVIHRQSTSCRSWVRWHRRSGMPEKLKEWKCVNVDQNRKHKISVF